MRGFLILIYYLKYRCNNYIIQTQDTEDQPKNQSQSMDIYFFCGGWGFVTLKAF